jgi:two-component system sensor histidine kinase BaeS
MLIRTKLSLMITMLMLLLLASYYFIALKYSQEAFLEFTSINAVDIEQDVNDYKLNELLDNQQSAILSPKQLVSFLGKQYSSTSHIVIDGTKVLANNLPETISRIAIKRNSNQVSITLTEGDRKYNLAINEGDKIIQTYQNNLVVSLPNSIFSMSETPSVNGLSVECKFLIALLFLAFVAISIIWYFTKLFLSPIDYLSSGIEDLVKERSHVNIENFRNDEIGQLAKNFNATVAELDKSEQVRKDMITDIAHELRTPLSNMQVKVEAVIDGVVTIDNKTFPSLLNHIKGLAHLVNDLQDVSLAEAGQLAFVFKNIAVDNVILNNFDLFNEAMLSKSITFQMRLGEPANIRVDAMRLNQVLFNVIENARKYTAENGKVELFGKRDKTHYVFGILNSGKGLSEDVVSQIFNRLYRAENQDNQLISGHGLGLAIAQKLTNLMGGTINLATLVNDGVLVTIAFPIVKED